ncbi:MAG: YlbF family regulator [Ruminococcus sp.]|nr:YlbF family regulator [Ruminococcus sp.]
MDIIEMTRELGKALQNDDRYIAYSLSKQACDNNEELQKMIASFEDLRSQLNAEIIKDDKDTDRIKELDQSIKSTYQKIMNDRNMVVFTGAQSALESLVSNINQIITLCANGEDPDTCEPSAGCSGSCATCGGCG